MLDSILNHVGNTPLVRLYDPMLKNVHLNIKMESFNPTGSVKDRAANFILNKMRDLGKINADTTIVESTSGNFGIALSSYCKHKGYKFDCVIDPMISSVNETLLRNLSTNVFKVNEPDENGGYLINRIRKVQQVLENNPNTYWVNQYENPYNAEAYYCTLGQEICDEVAAIDYVFVGVSSGGTITGISNKIKEVYPQAKIIAVDIVGSVIFGGPAKKRFIPGIGSSKVPKILEQARIDDVVYVHETEVIHSCHQLLQEHVLFVGGSSGANYAAIKKYFQNCQGKSNKNVVTLFADRGDRYCDTIYNPSWHKKLKQIDMEEVYV
ncbi:2,3-diaminopropionate biosynthesis protein SbnA [Hazenella sp. IB182357]|uniref:N-(2-amino-2-carboxyethyl)-L-glutamate synthase n=1 Tax=Polycladospora coralii TaxID=2771432 RepID=A0A926NA44_9BACL|nr:2,3-diaminopropionate biosynthesis protein SbnA [Polycladospora coralii]MBD1372682.1 2,3-diaminopropionate biosynthesis protein SbnA [Polycladospora coralii]MBS7531076.1 2,3-diaminopropionate biosynthesis protein SbnA [Polycladospora coralii]